MKQIVVKEVALSNQMGKCTIKKQSQNNYVSDPIWLKPRTVGQARSPGETCSDRLHQQDRPVDSRAEASAPRRLLQAEAHRGRNKRTPKFVHR